MKIRELGYGPTDIAPDVAHAAALTVCSHGMTADETRLVLDRLGLLEMLGGKA